MKQLHKLLERPLCFLDLETTGLKVEQDRIVEIAIVKINPDGSKETYVQTLNPLISIPKEASDVHGIKDEDVKDCPTLLEVGEKIIDFIDDSDIAGYNSNRFDIPMLYYELERYGFTFDYINRSKVDVLNIWTRQEARNLANAYRYYVGKEPVNAHLAHGDVLMTIEIFEKQLNKYSDLPDKIEDLALFSNYGKEQIDFKNMFIEKDGKLYYNFGKNKGILCTDDKAYLVWMLTSDMGSDVKQIVKELLDGTRQ